MFKRIASRGHLPAVPARPVVIIRDEFQALYTAAFCPATMTARVRWRLWSLATWLPGVCKANAHALLICGQRRSPLIDSLCRDGLDAPGGACWCGKLRVPGGDPR